MSRYGAGDTVGRFELVSPLGRGGMGEVWLARHVRTEAKYALKIVFRDAGDDDDVFRRFDREVKAAARIGHPGIVEVVDCDVDPRTGCPYLVMELLDGADLGAWRREVRPAPSVVVTMIRNALEPLAAAHALRGPDGASTPIVHRDLKPDNVFVLRHPVPVPGSAIPQAVKLLDFGIARQQGTDGTTGTLGGIGTPGYVSPEQAREAKQVGPASDVFSVGVMLYEALCGARPFEGGSVAETLALLLTAEPEQLSLRAPHLDPRLAGLVHRCLAKDPSQRPPDAGALRDELDRLLADDRVAATLDGPVGTMPMTTMPMGAADVAPPAAVAPTTPLAPVAAPPVVAPPKRPASRGTTIAVATVSAFTVLLIAFGVWFFLSGDEVQLPATPNLVPSLRRTDWSLRIGPYREGRSVLDVASLSRPALAPDGTLALLAQYDSGIVVWRLRDGEVADTHYTWRSADGLMDPVAAASGAVLAGLQGGVLLALEDDGDVVRVEIGSDETPHEIAVSHDGARIAVLCNSGRIFSARMPLTPGGLTRHALLGTRRMRTVSFDHAGRIVAGGDAAQVQRETENGGWEPLPLPVQGTVTAVGWDRTGALLASDETGNIMRHARARWSRIGGVHQPALAVQDTPHHGIVAVRGDGRIYAQADRDFAELAGFDEQREARYGGALVRGDNILLYNRFGLLVHAAGERWKSGDVELPPEPGAGCRILSDADGLESEGAPRVLLACGDRIARAGAEGLVPLDQVTLGGVSIPAARLAAVMREVASVPHDVAAGAVWRAARREDDHVIERWDPARDAWEVVLVNEPVERRVYRFVALDVVETPDGARLWAFDRANDVRVATVPAGPLARPVAFTTALTDTTLRQAVGLRFGATDVRLIATAEHAYLVYDARTIVEVARQGAPRLLRFGGEGRDEVLDANDIYWDTIVLREPITRLALAGGRPVVSQAGRLFEVVPGGAPLEWTVEGLPSPSWSIGDAVLDEGDASYLLLDAWLLRCAERRCVDAGTRGAIAFDRLDRAAPGVLAAFREGSTAYGLVTEPR